MAQDQQRVSIFPETNNYLVVWTRSSSGDNQISSIYGRIFDSSNIALTSEFAGSTSTGNHKLYPSEGIFNETHFVITYQSVNNIYGQLFEYDQNNNNQVSKLGDLFQINTNTEAAITPKVLVFNETSFLVVWDALTDNSNYDLYAQMMALENGSAVKVGNQTLINTHTVSHQANPAVAKLSENGHKFVVVWTSLTQDRSGEGVYGQIFEHSVQDGSLHKLNSEFLINTHTTNDQQNPKVSSISNQLHAFVVIWESNHHKDGVGLYGQVFNSINGERIQNEFLINNRNNSHQHPSDIIKLSDNSFIIVWITEIEGNEGTYSVIGKIYNLFMTSDDDDDKTIQDYKVMQIGQEFQIRYDETSNQYEPNVKSFHNNQQKFLVITKKKIRETALYDIFGKQYLFDSDANNSPYLNNTHSLTNQTIEANKKFSYQFSSEIFLDSDTIQRGDSLTFNSKLVSKKSLPKWLKFDGKSRTFSGKPNQYDLYMKDLHITVTAYDECNVLVTQNFSINNLDYIDKGLGVILSVVISLTCLISCFLVCFLKAYKTQNSKTKINYETLKNENVL
ncbi:dystroglycan-related [Anaeramoeba flamelloides]|uniref:Dystroglycan-related n=1 Tax=Anaeramoeba flamelloides TaxID=1746091 RepID=A0AAV7YG10_9EUKA|nr:dystroglycan-related [Anaeramoeba flamelloides]